MAADTVKASFTSSKQFWKLSVLLLACIGATVLIGTLIGIGASGWNSTKRVPVPASADDEANTETGVVIEDSKETSSSTLRLPGVAVVDMARVLAAHPSTGVNYELLQQKLAAIPLTADKKSRHWRELTAAFEWTESQKFVFRDIQQVIAAYAKQHNLKMVVDRTVRIDEPTSMVFYSPNEVNFRQIISAPGVQDITEQILEQLARERPHGIELQRLPKLEPSRAPKAGQSPGGAEY